MNNSSACLVLGLYPPEFHGKIHSKIDYLVVEMLKI